MEEKLIAKGVEPERLAVVRNWVDLTQIRPLGRPSAFRDELRLAPESFVVLYAGSVGSKQALEVVLDAAESLNDEPGVVFVIAGDGPEKEGLMARYGALTNVRFLPLQPERRLNELLNLADLHVLPQHHGIGDLVLPSKLGGMLASGRRLLVTADPGTELYEFLDGIASLVPAGDSKALHDEIRSLLGRDRDPGCAGLAKAAATLSREGCLAMFERLLLTAPSRAADAAPADPVDATGRPAQRLSNRDSR